ncbi:MAG: hypothetical protein AAGC97_18970, partial [Planctomycetota bacterium]
MNRRLISLEPLIVMELDAEDAVNPNARAPYPSTRMRRLRAHEWSRRLVRESHLSVDDLIWPLFVFDGTGTEAIASLPGVQRHGTDRIVDVARRAADLGIPAIAL